MIEKMSLIYSKFNSRYIKILPNQTWFSLSFLFPKYRNNRKRNGILREGKNKLRSLEPHETLTQEQKSALNGDEILKGESA